MSDRTYKKIIIFTIFWLIIKSIYLLPMEIELWDQCVRPFKELFPKNPTFDKIEDAVTDAARMAMLCLPKNYHKKIWEHLESRRLLIFIDCADTRTKCASVQLSNKNRGEWIVLYNQNVWDGKKCGCLSATFLHEFLHWAGIYDKTTEEEIKAYSCSLKCFGKEGCVAIPEKYKGKIDPKLCCE